MQQLTILGATGSIGSSTLDVVSRNSDKYKVFAVSGYSQVNRLVEIAIAFSPQFIVTKDKVSAQQLHQALPSDLQSTITLKFGDEGLDYISSHPQVDTVMAAIVGAAGLSPVFSAIRAGKKVLLANKESLVMSGELFIDAVKEHGASLIPVDSEHNAIFQCLPHDYAYGDGERSGIEHLLLTASGGPFRAMDIEALAHVTPEQACAHPNWDMGQKISVDSASMMNKGLEFIEARWLFGLSAENIKVVIHPQSTIHSMVQYIDGSVIAQLGNPDMRTPIAHALAYPERINAGVKALDFFSLDKFSFEAPCQKRFPNLFLAIDACKRGQAATTALNAANEVAVQAFLNEQIRFTDIYTVNNYVVKQHSDARLEQLSQVIAHDRLCRECATYAIEERKI
ncbi:1-deoxy-D-xylulose-5-phosphate reductoisomerase [Agaribacter flavus]|uniref:1-deoxy-D-xylulose 5-phosphate reductoisomerase n=1 Tax=Agaribacter flavus TaxID=1902781 RepID=A0ABV7FQF1_9ALTE